MLPEPPHPPSAPRVRQAPPPGAPLARRGSDLAALAPGASASPSTAAPAAASKALPRPRTAVRWPLPGVALLLAASAALLAGAAAWLLTELLGVPAAWAAAASAALALLASAIPTLAVAVGRAPVALATATATPGDAAPLRDRETGAFRPDMFMELAEREWARARRYGTGAGLLVVDLDRSALLQEAHGAAAADAFLTALTRQTSPTLRGADLMTRLAPTRLGVFLAHADPTGALDVAERIRERAEALDLPWPAAGGGQAVSLRASVSVGVAPLRPAHLSLQALLHDADDALAAARQAGGNCVRAAPVDESGSALPGSWRNDHRARPQ